jgi:predicted dinucleotide-binding enzyme
VASDADGFAALASVVRSGGTALKTRAQYTADIEALASRAITGVNYELHASDGVLERLADAVVSGRIVAPPITPITLDDVPGLNGRPGAERKDSYRVLTTLGVIGSGNIGGTVARLAVEAGYNVVLSKSRGPQTLENQLKELGQRARAATSVDAAAAGDLVLVSIPPRAYTAAPAEPLAGKPVLDAINYVPERDGWIPEMSEGPLSSSEVLQRHLGPAHVIKVLNNIAFWHLRRLARPSARPTAALCPSPETTRSPRQRYRRSSTRSATTAWMPGRSVLVAAASSSAAPPSSHHTGK